MRSYADLTSLKGRCALVTGGATALGRAVADAFAELGAAVAIIDRPGSAADEVARALTDKYGVLTTAHVVDFADEAALRRVPQRVVDRCGRLDILVNHVGGDSGDASAEGFDDWRKAADLALAVPYVLTQQASTALRASGKGAVVNIAASTGKAPLAAATRAGLVEMTRALAITLAPDVRVNAIAPALEKDADTKRAKALLTRSLRDEDFKGAVVFLASDLAAFVTGQCLILDGGRSIP